jgi:hypothetical protein
MVRKKKVKKRRTLKLKNDADRTASSWRSFKRGFRT